jgi:hypothetical protein
MAPPIAGNLARVRARIEAACRRAGRRPQDVTLVAVTKTAGAAEIGLLAAEGVRHVGENRVQSAQQKRPAVAASLTWHMVGALQTNKAGKAVDLFEAIHSLDRRRLAEALSRRLEEANRTMEAYIQVSLAGEPQKGGLPPEEAAAFLETLRRDHPRLRPVGLMTMPPEAADPERSRPYFARLRELAGRLGLTGLSMGMTNDFEAAVEEGATVVRIGRALFEAEVPCPS